LTVVFFFVFILVLGLQLWIHFKTQKKLKDLLTPSLFNNVGFQLFKKRRIRSNFFSSLIDWFDLLSHFFYFIIYPFVLLCSGTFIKLIIFYLFELKRDLSNLFISELHFNLFSFWVLRYTKTIPSGSRLHLVESLKRAVVPPR